MVILTLSIAIVPVTLLISISLVFWRSSSSSVRIRKISTLIWVESSKGLEKLLDKLFDLKFLIQHSASPSDQKTLLKWWEIYPDGIRVLYKGSEIVGAVGLWPISEQASADLEAGKISEKELPIEKAVTNIWYIGAVVIRKDIRDRYRWKVPSSILLSGAIGEWISNFYTFPNTILGLAYSGDGKNKLSTYGFYEYQTADRVKDKVPLYRLRIENESELNKIKLPLSERNILWYRQFLPSLGKVWSSAFTITP